MEREWIIRKRDKKTGKSELMSDIIYIDKSVAKKATDNLNAKDNAFDYTLYELVAVEEVCKCSYEMTEQEEKEYNQAILDIDEDLQKIISFDEWAAREYGETSVDYYSTALSLYQAGYRKVKDMKKGYEE